jgi:hypothetical protein
MGSGTVGQADPPCAVQADFRLRIYDALALQHVDALRGGSTMKFPNISKYRFTQRIAGISVFSLAIAVALPLNASADLATMESTSFVPTNIEYVPLSSGSNRLAKVEFDLDQPAEILTITLNEIELGCELSSGGTHVSCAAIGHAIAIDNITIFSVNAS